MSREGARFPPCALKASSRPSPACAPSTACPSRDAGRGARPDGRKRRGQVDADEGPWRHLPAGREGRIIVGETAGEMSSPLEAKAKGIVFIHQELSLAEELTVAENIYLGELPKELRPGRLEAALFDKTNAILQAQGGLRCPDPGRGPVHRQPADGRDRARADRRRQGRDLRRADRLAYRCREKVVLFEVIEDLKNPMASASSTSRTGWRRSSRSPIGSAFCGTVSTAAR
jgi:hypothetical protein